MLIVGVNPEDDCIAGNRVCDLRENLRGVSPSDLQKAAFERSTTQVDAHRDQPILADVTVPRIEVGARRRQTVHAPFETADGTAARQVIDCCKEHRVVGGQFERPRQRPRRRAQLDADAFVTAFVEICEIGRIEQQREQCRIDESSQLEVSLSLEARTSLSELVRRPGPPSSGTGNANHED